MKKILIIVLCFLLSMGGLAQTKYYEKVLPLWADLHDIQSVIALSDSNFIIAGNYTFYSPFKSTAYIARIDKNADIIWQQTFNEAGENAVFDVIEGNFGHYVAAGTLIEDSPQNSNGNGCAYFVNGAGYFQNFSLFENEEYDSQAYRITRSSDGGYLAVGYLVNGGYTHYTLYLVKLNAVGEKQWQRIYTLYNSHCQFRDVIAAPDGGYYLTGSVNMNWDDFVVPQGNMLIMKIDAIGNVLWSKVHNVGAMDQSLCFAQTEDNGFILGGGSAPGNAQKARPYLLKTDSLGNLEWGKGYFLEGGEGAVLSVLPLNNGFIATGSYSVINSSSTQIDMFLIRTDMQGNTLWYRTYGNPTNNFGGLAYDYAYDFTPTLDGGYMIVGRKDSMLSASEGYAYAWLVKTNCIGLLTVPQAAYSYSISTGIPAIATFTNHSQYAYPDSIDGGYYVWQWGDGSQPYICGQGYEPCPPDAQPLAHTYQTTGIYPVTLQAIVCNDTSTYTRAVCLGVEPNPQAQFTYTDFGGAIQFTNLSQNAYLTQGGYCTWNFGDGSPPVYDANPTHTYTENGNYPVTLTLIVCQDTSVYMQFVQVQTVGVPPPNPLKGENSVVVYPNPAQNLLHFTLQNSATPPLGGWGVTGGWQIALYTPAGHRVLHHVVLPASVSASIEIGHLPVGMYFYTVESGGAVLARGKVAVVR